MTNQEANEAVVEEKKADEKKKNKKKEKDLSTLQQKIVLTGADIVSIG